MSKIFDVKNMYGQDFNIVTTNAPTNIITDPSTELLANTLLISSPSNEANNADNNMPSLFVTDYNAQPLRLTYPFYIGNGLSSYNNSYLFIDIDNKTITTYNNDGTGPLKVDTSYLESASFNKKGVVQIGEIASITRNLKDKYKDNSSSLNDFENKSFINIDAKGILYVDDNLLNLINTIVDIRVKQKINYIKVLMNVNLKMWIEVIEIDDVSVNPQQYNVGTINKVELKNYKMTKLLCNLHYFSFNHESETITITDESKKIYGIECEINKTNVYEYNDELYEHILPNITLTFCPNYFIINNSSYDQEYRIVFNIDKDSQSAITFIQNKFKFMDNEGNRNFDLQITGSPTLPEYISINDALSADNIQLIKNVIVNNEIFKDIMFNDNDNIIRYMLDISIYNMYDSRHYSLYHDYINFATDGNQSINLTNEHNDDLYKFIDGILLKENNNEYTTTGNDPNVKYVVKTGINDVISQDGIGMVPVNNFIETLPNGVQIIYILSKLTVSNTKTIMGEYTVKTPLKLDLSKPQNTQEEQP